MIVQLRKRLLSIGLCAALLAVGLAALHAAAPEPQAELRIGSFIKDPSQALGWSDRSDPKAGGIYRIRNLNQAQAWAERFGAEALCVRARIHQSANGAPEIEFLELLIHGAWLPEQEQGLAAGQAVAAPAGTGDQAASLEVVGVLESNAKGELVLVKDPQSRSRISYVLTNAERFPAIRKALGAAVRIKGKASMVTPWSGSLEIAEWQLR